MIHKLVVFLKFQKSRKARVALIILIIGLFTGTVFLLPIKNPVQYSLEYQRDDAFGIIDRSNINQSTMENNLQNQAKNDIITTINSHYITSGSLAYNDTIMSSGLQLKLEFREENTTELAIKSLWYRSSDNATLSTSTLSLTHVQTSALPDDTSLPSQFDGILEIPTRYRSNFTMFYYGFEIDASQFRGLNIETVGEHFREEMEDLSTTQMFLFGDALMEFSTPSTDVLDAINSSYPTIILQNFILILSVLAGLMVILYFLLQSTISSDLKQYEILYHRGYREEDIEIHIPIFLVLLYTVFGVFLGLGIFYFTGQTQLTYQHILPVGLVGLIAAGAGISAMREFKQLKPRDATEFHINPSIAEYVFLFLSIISLLVNVYLNLPVFRYISLFLVLAIYVSISLGIAGLMYKGVQVLRKKLLGFYQNKDYLSKSQTEALFLNSINIRKYRKHLKLAILFGIIFIIIIAHINLSYQMTDDLKTQNEDQLLWASYSQYQNVRTLDETDLRWTGFIPATYAKLGTQLSGAIVTSDVIFDQFDLRKRHNEDPALYLSDQYDTLTESVFDLEGVSSAVSVGEESKSLDLDPTTYFDDSEKILRQFDFLLFVDNSYYENYNQSVQLVITIENTLHQTQRLVEDQLSEPVYWMEIPRDDPLRYSLKQNLSSQFDFTLLAIIGISAIFILGYLEPRILVQREIDMLKQRGFLNKSSISGVSLVTGITTMMYFVLSVLGTIIILGLLRLFSVLPQVSIEFQLLPLLTISFLGSVGWSTGNLVGHLHVILNDGSE